MRLAPADIAADGVSPELVKTLDSFAGLRNEMASMAARLAADVGLERLYGAGDHLSDVASPSSEAMKAAVAAEPGLTDLFNHNTPEFRAVPEEAMKMAAATEIMPVFKWKNPCDWQIRRRRPMPVDASQRQGRPMARQWRSGWRPRTCAWPWQFEKQPRQLAGRS